MLTATRTGTERRKWTQDANINKISPMIQPAHQCAETCRSNETDPRHIDAIVVLWIHGVRRHQWSSNTGLSWLLVRFQFQDVSSLSLASILRVNCSSCYSCCCCCCFRSKCCVDHRTLNAFVKRCKSCKHVMIHSSPMGEFGTLRSMNLWAFHAKCCLWI